MQQAAARESGALIHLKTDKTRLREIPSIARKHSAILNDRS
jgi:hypothetical protein